MPLTIPVKVRIKSRMTNLVLDEMIRQDTKKELRRARLRRLFDSFSSSSSPSPSAFPETGAEDDLSRAPDPVIERLVPEDDPERLSFDDILEDIGGAGDGDVDETIEFSAEGLMTFDDGGLVSVKYAESARLGMDSAQTSLTYSLSDPALVTMVRTGTGGMSLSFNASSRRQICQYDLGFAKLELCVVTRKVTNSLTAEGGKLILDYFVEIKGLKTEHTFFEMEVRPIRFSGAYDGIPDERGLETELFGLLDEQRAIMKSGEDHES